jgi:NAD(P)-dependent dehydrogenase (short-subunit alcohol dehydrogenase family)
MQKKLKGKTVILTGGASGIGKASALLMAGEGACVAVVDINEEGVRNTADEITAQGGRARAFCADVRDSGAIRDAVSKTEEYFGGIDILVNAAGGSARVIGKRSSFIEAGESTWDWVLGVNLKGPMICTQAVLGRMIQQKKGKIINFGSVAGVNGLPDMADYCAAKGGIIALTKGLAVELGQYNIQVNCISPGSIATRGDGPQTLLGRLGTAEEVAELVLFLASDNSCFITGQNYIIDGGRTLSTRW